MLGQRVFFAMPGDFGRAVKIIGFFIVAVLTVVRFISITPHYFYFVIGAAILAVIVVWASVLGSFNRLDFVRANEFTEPADFKRAAVHMHLAEVVAAAAWVLWLGFSFGSFDTIATALIVAFAIWALIERRRIMKISQPRNVWEK